MVTFLEFTSLAWTTSNGGVVGALPVRPSSCPATVMHKDESKQRRGIWAHAWGSDPALGPIQLGMVYDWAVTDSRSHPIIRLQVAVPIVIDHLTGATEAAGLGGSGRSVPYVV